MSLVDFAQAELPHNKSTPADADRRSLRSLRSARLSGRRSAAEQQ